MSDNGTPATALFEELNEIRSLLAEIRDSMQTMVNLLHGAVEDKEDE